ncbi:hypothetical protein Clacol_010215 [Clathrus columnatus]|uniref:RING-type domain-containing protein n=1 Tax=Clathrus columnatus TaxID=1419009 RepID=A0AAV5AUF0_9AGAM|nr:hypothetical protein Clacol_010215 [Clathrus columnatus]
MLFGSFSLKRKVLAILFLRRADQTTTNSVTRIPPPELGIQTQGPTSGVEITEQVTQAACVGTREDEGENFPQEIVEQKEDVKELQARFEELKEEYIRNKQRAEQDSAKLKKLDEQAMCMVCRDIIQNPQLMQCGHAACYRCLRNWWTQPPERYDGSEIIDTEAEFDSEEDQENGAGEEDEHNLEEPTPQPEPRPPRRHLFPSAVNRAKRCPYCTSIVLHRPIPIFQLRHMIEILIGDLPPAVQAERNERLTRRRDLWRGIFHPENRDSHDASQHDQPIPMPVLMARHEPQPGPPFPPQADIILNQMTQLHRRAVELVAARRERLRAQAYEQGRRRGMLEARERWDRAEEARQAVGLGMDRPVQEQQPFWRVGEGNLPRREIPIIGFGRNVAIMRGPAQEPEPDHDPAAM